MRVVIIEPSGASKAISEEGFGRLRDTGFSHITPRIAALLGCAPGLVDVLATGEDYAVYTIFDSEQEANPAATRAVAELTGITFDEANEDELLRGPVLVVKDGLSLL